MKKVFKIALSLIIFMSFVPSLVNATVLGNSNEVKALEKISQSPYLKQYEKNLLSKKPYLSKETVDANGNVTGHIVQYEVMLEDTRTSIEDSENEIVEKLSSLLAFVYNSKTDELEAYLMDFSSLISQDAIYAIDLVNDTEEKMNIAESDNFDELEEIKTNIEIGKEELEKTMEEAPMPRAGCPTWTCTRTKSGGGTIAPVCAAVIGTACYVGGKLNLFTYIACSPIGAVWGCYVPKWTVCTAGYWQTKYCPM